jgi:hypothetical protein
MAQKLPRSKQTLGIRIKPREGLWVNYQLRLRGITHQKLGDQLGIRRDTVTKVIRGTWRSARVEEALPRVLGYPSFEAMIAAILNFINLFF